MVQAGQAADRAVLLAGATGLVGREVLAALLADKSYHAVHTVGRRTLPASVDHPHWVQHAVDFSDTAALQALPAVSECFIALGTTIKVAGSQAAFRAIDLDAVVNVAKACRQRGARRLGVVSAMGADAQSSILYNRTKGQMEEAVEGLGFEVLVIARPSMLAGDRAALQQPLRRGEGYALTLSRTLRPLIPANYRSIAAQDVACALVQGVRNGTPGVHRLLSGAMQGASTAHK